MKTDKHGKLVWQSPTGDEITFIVGDVPFLRMTRPITSGGAFVSEAPAASIPDAISHFKKEASAKGYHVSTFHMIVCEAEAAIKDEIEGAAMHVLSTTVDYIANIQHNEEKSVLVEAARAAIKALQDYQERQSSNNKE